MRHEFDIGQKVILSQAPDGSLSSHYKVTVGNTYTVLGWMGSCLETTSDVKGRAVSIYHGRFEPAKNN